MNAIVIPMCGAMNIRCCKMLHELFFGYGNKMLLLCGKFGDCNLAECVPDSVALYVYFVYM